MYPEDEYVIKTRPPTMEGNTWKQNVQLKIREQQLADQAMPIARYHSGYVGGSVMTPQWSTSLVLREKGFSGQSSTAKRNFTMWLNAKKESTTQRWIKDEEI